MKLVRFSSLIITGMVLMTVSVSAQEMRVYTVVRNLAAGSGRQDKDAPVLARSLTLFHAGKVYDYVESAREVTVYEPAHHRFTLLNERRRTVTEVTQDEVRQFVTLVEQEGWKRMEAAQEQPGTDQVRSLNWLKFQLKPDFDTSFDQARMSVTLLEHNCRYSADGQAPPSRAVVDTYLRFADAAAELNSVLHPQALLPRPRLRLNEELRQRELLPVVVDLQANLERPLHLQARHKWDWKFQPTDRQLITSWESLLNDSTQRRLTFRQYQQELLSVEVSRNR